MATVAAPIRKTRKDFQRLAELRAREAIVLAKNGEHQGAYYLGGFAVECALKACIAKKTRRHEFPADRAYASRVYTHNPDELLKLAHLETQLDRDMKTRPELATNWGVVKGWNVESRYEASGLKGERHGYCRDFDRRCIGLDQAVLVKSDRDIEARVSDALSRVRMPVTLLEWNYAPQLEEWQLILATPWYDSKGPRTTYQALVGALEKAGIYEQVPMRRVFVRSPNDPLVKALVQEAKDQKEGRVHILKHGDSYSLVFPAAIGIVAGGGPIARRSFSSLSALKQFLEEDLQVTPSSIEAAFEEIKRRGAGSISHVGLTARQAKKFGLA